jgi:hypothetical protein
MDGATVRGQTPAEFFRELVDLALERQQLEADELTSWYVVNLLCGFVQMNSAAAPSLDEPLALRLGRALECGGVEQRARLRQLGDVSLFISGFFSDSLRRKLVDVDYYVSLGGYAYGSLSRRGDESFARVFGELAGKFVGFVDVLSEVSERAGLTSNTDLLRLYEKWLRTGSRRNGELLVEQGIVPNASIGSRFVQ